jgi:hypothetical protein
VETTSLESAIALLSFPDAPKHDPSDKLPTKSIEETPEPMAIEDDYFPSNHLRANTVKPALSSSVDDITKEEYRFPSLPTAPSQEPTDDSEFGDSAPTVWNPKPRPSVSSQTPAMVPIPSVLKPGQAVPRRPVQPAPEIPQMEFRGRNQRSPSSSISSPIDPPRLPIPSSNYPPRSSMSSPIYPPRPSISSTHSLNEGILIGIKSPPQS